MKQRSTSLCHGDILDQIKLVRLWVDETNIVLASEYDESCNVEGPKAGEVDRPRSDINDVLTVYENLQHPCASRKALRSLRLEEQYDRRYRDCGYGL